MRLKATCKVWYAGREREPDEEFEIESGDETNAKILVGIGKATEVTGDAVPAKPESAAPEPKSEPESKSEPETQPEAQSDPVPAKRRYPRRDMRAEE